MKKDMEATLRMALDGVTSGKVIACGKSKDGHNYVLLKSNIGSLVQVEDVGGAVYFDISANLGDTLELQIRSNESAEWVLVPKRGSE